MARSKDEILKQAMEFYVSGQIVEAKALLLDLVRVDPHLEAGWMFLSFTLEDPGQKADCLRRVLAINPQNQEAKVTLDKLLPSQESPQAPIAFPPPHISPFTVDISHANEDPNSIGGDSSRGEVVRSVDRPPPIEKDQEKSGPVLRDKPEKATPAPSVAEKAAKLKKPESAPSVSVKKKSPSKPPLEEKKGGKIGCTFLFLTIAILVFVGLCVSVFWNAGLFNNAFTSNEIPTMVTLPNNSPVALTLPPRWTETPTSTATLPPTITLTPTPTASPTMVPPSTEVMAAIQQVEKQVVDLRGLELYEEPDVYLINRDQAEQILQSLLKSIYQTSFENEKKEYVALGLIKPTFDLTKFETNRISDGIAGFYDPKEKAIYIISGVFGGYEKLIFAHEFDHALVQQHFPSAGILYDDPICRNDTQRCDAINAFIEGDATLLMSQWKNQYATPLDLLDIENRPEPFFGIPDQNAPPFVDPLSRFPYTYGAQFVFELWNRGYWANVNKVYQNLPLSTEQILHVEKYWNKEKPVYPDVPDVQSVLGADWRPVASDTLGEYMTYLILGFGMDASTLLSTTDLNTLRAHALDAAAGWGGDHILIFSNDATEQTIMSVEWVWDTSKDATEFQESILAYLDIRFRGKRINRTGADCWEVNQETTCVFQQEKKTVWILASDVQTVDDIYSAYT